MKENQLIHFEDGEAITVQALTRWTLLLEALEELLRYSEDTGKDIDWEHIVKYVKPHKGITKYIEECYQARLDRKSVV